VVVVGYKKEKITERYEDEYRGVSLTYAHQREQKELAHALLQAETYVEDGFLLAHGDNVFGPSARDDLRRVERSDADATLLVEELEDESARNSAVVVTASDGDRVTDVVKRSDDPPSNLGVVGFYSLPTEVFEACRRTDESERGEYELGDTLSTLARDCDTRAVRLRGGRVNVNRKEDLRRAESSVGD